MGFKKGITTISLLVFFLSLIFFVSSSHNAFADVGCLDETGASIQNSQNGATINGYNLRGDIYCHFESPSTTSTFVVFPNPLVYSNNVLLTDIVYQKGPNPPTPPPQPPFNGQRIGSNCAIAAYPEDLNPGSGHSSVGTFASHYFSCTIYFYNKGSYEFTANFPAIPASDTISGTPIPAHSVNFHYYIGDFWSTISFEARSPVNLLVTDSNSKKVGFSSGGPPYYEDLPSSFYSGPEADPEVITIPSSSSIGYHLDILGTGTGPYTIKVQKHNSVGDVIGEQVLTGTASSGSTESKDFILHDDGTITIGFPQSTLPPVTSVGGMGIPIDSISLFLAGVQASALWMIPVLIIGGVVMLTIKRNRKDSTN